MMFKKVTRKGIKKKKKNVTAKTDRNELTELNEQVQYFVNVAIYFVMLM